MATLLSRVDHASEWGRWSLTRAVPSPELRGLVLEYQGYREASAAAVIRRETPVPVVPVILIFEAGFRLRTVDGWTPLDRSFVAGLHEHSVLVGSDGRAHCAQIDLTPPGARCLLGVEPGDLRNRVVDLEAVIGAQVVRLVDRLAEAPDWPARFELLDRYLVARVSSGSPGSPGILRAWARLRDSGGAAPVAGLAAEAGLSRQTFSERFAREIGLSPKRAGVLLRLERALAMLGDPGAAALADVAVACGYYDQAHFNRDMQAFCGETPAGVRAQLSPDGTGLMARA